MRSGLTQNPWINFIGFNICWILCVLFGNSAILPVTGLLICHLLLHSKPWTETRVISTLGLLGFSIDTLLTLTGVFRFPHSAEISLPPFWLLLLWLSFSATIRQSLAWLTKLPVMASLAGAIGGPLAYYTASRLGAVDLGFSIAASLVLLALIWAVILPLFFWLSQQLEKTACCVSH